MRRLLPDRRTPLTLGYAAVLTATTTVLWVLPHRDGHTLLHAVSTDIDHLSHVPVRVLVASALWLPGRDLPVALVLLVLLIAPVERALGPLRTAAAFAAGHVGATLLTEGGLWLGRALSLTHAPTHRLDVGISYGVHAVAGVLLGLLRPRLRPYGVAAAVLLVGLPLVLDPEMTTTGHLISLLIGVGLVPLLARGRPRRYGAELWT